MKAALIVEDRTRAIRNIQPGELFEDCNGQQFAKLGTVINRRGQRRHMIQCLWSPFGRKKPGPISGAFFTHIGSVLYLGGNRPVHRATPALALLLEAAA